jgi:predicted SAM-dependent methyltransferase
VTGSDILQTHSGIRVNIGCGLTPTPGWINFDNSFSVRAARWPAVSGVMRACGVLNAKSAELAKMGRDGRVRFANAASRIPCASGSVDVAYSSHMIEHLDRGEARAFLTEVRRVLRPGGVVRIDAPDLTRLVSDYLASGDADEFIAGSHLGLSRPAGLRAWVKWTLVGPRHHLWMYDAESLTRLLRESGFAEAAALPPGSTRIADPGELDLWERAAESVYVEAVRPS